MTLSRDDVSGWSVAAGEGYRHFLSHRFGEGPSILCIGLNPSTATMGEHDATTATIERIAKFNGFGAWAIVNVFDVIETDSRKLADLRWRWRSDEWSFWIRKAARQCRAIWPCWGSTPRKIGALHLAHEALALISYEREMGTRIAEFRSFDTPTLCVSVTKNGDPRHPLYMPTETTLKPWIALDCKGWPTP